MEEEHQKAQEKKCRDLRQDVDRLLDKISREGITSLTGKEREFLRKASKEYQKDLNP
jgi:hypothetical protein